MVIYRAGKQCCKRGHWKIKFPTGFASNIKNILTKKGEFGGVKANELHTFIKVIILVDLYIGKYTTF